MNAGMYGMADGRGGQFPKLAGIAGKNGTPTTAFFNVAGFGQVIGAASNSVSVTNGVRVKALSISGRGVLKALAVAESGTVTPTYRVELFIDGSRVLDATWTASGSANMGPPLLGGVGNTINAAPFFEHVPFSSNVDVFITVSGIGNPATLVYLADIYQ